MRRFRTFFVFTEIQLFRFEIRDLFGIVCHKLLGFIVLHQHFPYLHRIIIERKAVIARKFGDNLFGGIVLSQSAGIF